MATKKHTGRGSVKLKRASKKDLNHLFGVTKVNPHNIEQKANPNKSLLTELELDKHDVGNRNLAGIGYYNPDYDPTVHPLYYNALPNGIECWDVTEHFPANVGMSMKHLWRAGLKPGQDTVQDYKKAIQYIERQIQKISGKTRSMKD